jgi:low affinity Fe/Cu permease
MRDDGHSSFLSTTLHAVDSWTSKAWVAALLSVAATVALVLTVVAGSDGEVTALAAVVQVVTLIMVFVVQHTQARDQRVAQRKLDELLRASPRTDDSMVMLEAGSDDDLDRASERLKEQSPYG